MEKNAEWDRVEKWKGHEHDRSVKIIRYIRVTFRQPSVSKAALACRNSYNREVTVTSHYTASADYILGQ